MFFSDNKIKECCSMLNTTFNKNKKGNIIKGVNINDNERINKLNSISKNNEDFFILNIIVDCINELKLYNMKFTNEQLIEYIQEKMFDNEIIFIDNIIKTLDEKGFLIDKDKITTSFLEKINVTYNKLPMTLLDYYVSYGFTNPNEKIEFILDNKTINMLISLVSKKGKEKIVIKKKMEKYNKMCDNDDFKVVKNIKNSLFLTNNKSKIVLLHNKNNRGILFKDLCQCNYYDYVVYILENGKYFLTFSKDFLHSQKIRDIFKVQKEKGSKDEVDFWIRKDNYLKFNFDYDYKINVENMINKFA